MWAQENVFSRAGSCPIDGTGGLTGAIDARVAGVTGGDADAAETVRRFLAALEARDLGAAAALTGPGLSMTFPGGVRMTRLEELVEWARPRYRHVGKTIERVETAGEGTVVWCFGTLAGEWPDGTPFAGIRFVDRFELSDGLIVRQDVWNDLAEARA